MKYIIPLLAIVSSFPVAFAQQANALPESKPLTIDLTTPVKSPSPAPLGMGTSLNPDGKSVGADSRSFFLNGEPWIPIAGELQYSRYPREEWREAMLKMKAGGLNTINTYVFWIHHEEIEGKFDWSGQRSLRDFLQMAKEVGLKVIVRMGTYCNGECRNGGFPDWLKAKRVKLRSTDPEYLKYVKILFREEAAQMKGLLWKDGGPVIGAQLENESRDGLLLLTLKKMAIEEGIDVPFYVITGWQGGVPKEGLLPLFGGYPIGFGSYSKMRFRIEYLFNRLRSTSDLGAELTDIHPSNTELLEQFPYACVEIGGGMMSSYNKRVKIDPDWVGALALAKLGSGNNMPGYYIYQGGVQPMGQLSSLQQNTVWKPMPIRNYDYYAPLGSCGQVRRQYHLLRLQHLFLQDFGSALVRMPAYFPDVQPKNVKDFDTLRWAVRADAQGRGFLFFNNEQSYDPLPEHKNIRFELKTASGPVLVPEKPITIPSRSYGIMPVKLDIQGLLLDYATVQPLCHMGEEDGSEVYFFSAMPGIRPELKFNGEPPLEVSPGTGVAAVKKTSGGKTISFVVLTKEQGEALYRLPFAGRERLFLSDGGLFADQNELKLQASSSRNLSVYPPLASIRVGGASLTSTKEGLFSRFSLPATSPAPAHVSAVLKKPASPLPGPDKGYEEATWKCASEYGLDIPKSLADRHVVLDIEYRGDGSRLYVGDQLFMDQFSSGLPGDPMSIALWRIPKDDLSKIRLLVLPRYSNPPVSNTEAPSVTVLGLETTTLSR